MAVVKLSSITQTFRVVRESLSVAENTRGRPNTASFDLITKAGFAAPTHSQEVLVFDDSLTYKLFGGIISAVTQDHAGFGKSGLEYTWNVSCTDFEIFLHKHLHVQRYINLTMKQIIQQVCSASARDIDTSLIPDGPTVPVYTANYRLPADIISDLCDSFGFTYWVDYDKKLNIVSTLGNTAAIELTTVSKNYANLRIEVDRSQLRNSVFVRGGNKASAPVTQTWTGDGVEGNFPLQYKPFSQFPPAFINEVYNTASFDSAKWTEFDVTNPSPPPGWIGSDGYIKPYPASQTNHYTSLQVAGGPGSYGSVGLVGKVLYARTLDHEIVQDFISTTAGDMVFGFSDGTGVGLATIQHGIRVKAAGAISIMEAGVETAVGTTYLSDALTTYRFRIKLKAAGAVYYVQSGANVGTINWTTIYESSTGTTANLAVAPVLVKSGVAGFFRTLYRAPIANASLTVAGVVKTLGWDGVDNSSGVDALLNADTLQLRFFGSSPGPSTIPANGAAIVLTYTFAQPIITNRLDPVSIGKIAALEGTDGVYETYISDASISSDSQAQDRAEAELKLYANPEISVSWSMPPSTFSLANRPKAGQIIRIATGGLDDPFLIQEVKIGHLGNDHYSLDIRAGSKLRGLEDYLQALIAQGRRFPQDNNEQLDTAFSVLETFGLSDSASIRTGGDLNPADTLSIGDSFVSANGTLPPWKWGPDAQAFKWDQFEWQ